nr:DUF397 domain-containing protein [Micromonospora sp. DSM 115978]
MTFSRSRRLTPTWTKSTRSNGSDGCVEARTHGDGVQIRDSKDRTGPLLTFNPTAYLGFLTAIRIGDLPPR